MAAEHETDPAPELCESCCGPLGDDDAIHVQIRACWTCGTVELVLRHAGCRLAEEIENAEATA